MSVILLNLQPLIKQICENEWIFYDNEQQKVLCGDDDDDNIDYA